ncbi:MAG: DUF418 domain-containing protein [Aeromicrobium sp.]|uniref:DUF418 domain-containing protein n=1 Tax=Aeromicrobium sp. TaxID=1871063 RepID=UPI003C5A1AB1
MRASGRVVAVDLARGLALAGMMLSHLGPVQIGDVAPINEIVSTGRAAVLFALLAGVSLTLVQQRDPEGAGSLRATLVRGLLLVLLGLSLGSLRDMPVLIILAVYGLLIVSAAPLRGVPTSTLVLLTGAWALLAPLGLLVLRIHHDPVLSEQPSWSDVQDPWRLISTMLFWGGYPAVVWMAYLLAGLIIGRLDLTDRVTAARLAVGGVVAVVATLSVAWLRDRDWAALFDRNPYEPATWDDLWVVGPHTSMPLNVVGAIGSAALVLGLAGLVVRSAIARRLVAPISAAGAMSLTLYTIHVLWTWGLRLDSDRVALGSWEGWTLQVVVLFTAAAVYRRFWRRGPLEQAFRWLTVDGWLLRRAKETPAERTRFL